MASNYVLTSNIISAFKAWFSRFIICMAVPFAEVIMHTYIDLMRHKAEDLENGEKV